MSRKRVLTNRQCELIRKLHAKGVSQVDLAEIFNVSPFTIWYHLNQDYTPPVPKYKLPTLLELGDDRRRKLSPEDVVELKAEYETGRWTERELAGMFHVSYGCVRYHCIPGEKERINRRSAELHHLYVTPEDNRKRALDTYRRKKALIKKLKEGD